MIIFGQSMKLKADETFIRYEHVFRAETQLSLQLISKEIRRAEREYMNMHPPPPN